jgi:hypothetical protein
VQMNRLVTKAEELVAIARAFKKADEELHAEGQQ